MALTGAGISTESGIPDFRGPEGVWTRDPTAERLSHIDAYLADPTVRVESWQRRMAHPAWTAAPNSGHLALAELERRGRLQSLVTQNIDGLHALAGTSPDILVEIHGTMRDVACLSCGERGPAEATFQRVRAGEEDPPCRSCGGILKSATISFGQALVPADLERAQVAAATCDNASAPSRVRSIWLRRCCMFSYSTRVQAGSTISSERMINRLRNGPNNVIRVLIVTDPVSESRGRGRTISTHS